MTKVFRALLLTGLTVVASMGARAQSVTDCEPSPDEAASASVTEVMAATKASAELVSEEPVADFTVLRAEPTQARIYPWSFHLTECETLGSRDDTEENGPEIPVVLLDCTQVVEDLIRDQLGSDAGPLAHRVLIPAQVMSGTIVPLVSGLPCNVTELDTAIGVDELESAAGIGFEFSGKARVTRVLKKDELLERGRARTRSGSDVVLHRFSALLPCWMGTASASYHAQYLFEPFVETRVDEDQEPIRARARPARYELTGGVGKTRFDRTQEVLDVLPWL